MSPEIKNTEMGLLVSGAIHFSNVLRLRRRGDRLIRNNIGIEIQVDLSGVTSSDVSGLSLLLRWMHYAKKQGKRVHYISIPLSLLKVARICGINEMISE